MPLREGSHMCMCCSARCVKQGTSGENSTLEDSLCDQDEMPPRAQVCFVACPQDCVMAPWGPWSNCPPVSGNDLVAY